MTGKISPSKSFQNFFIKLTATFFGIGYSPWAPGTMGSLAGLFLAWFIDKSSIDYLLIFLVLGFLVCKSAVDFFSSGDPSCFVMDEVCGMMITVLFIPRTFYLYLAGFILFRIFDIAKPWPISRIQQSKSPWAIMWDDILAGIFANLLIRGYLFYFH